MPAARLEHALAPRRRFAPLVLLRVLMATRRQRAALGQLEPRLLDDIGLKEGTAPREDAWSETRRPFWELPSRHHW